MTVAFFSCDGRGESKGRKGQKGCRSGSERRRDCGGGGGGGGCLARGKERRGRDLGEEEEEEARKRNEPTSDIGGHFLC